MSKPPSDLDEAVLSAIRAGNINAAFNMLWSAHSRSILNLCRRKLDDEMLAEDVQQVVAEQTFEALPRFSKGSITRWLFRVAENRCLDVLKVRRSLSSRIMLMDELPEVCEFRPDPEEQQVEAEQGAILWCCIEELSMPLRTVMVAHYVDGYSFEEIAVAYGVRAGTVRVRAARARKKLRRRLKEEGVE